MYDPDRMPNPVRGDLNGDHTDEQIPWMNHVIWAEDINDAHARVLKARYYGEISYIDDCLGRVLDAVEHRPDVADTVICFFADHGDLLGDHHGWQKECFFEASCRVPLLVSWPARLPAGAQSAELACLTDLFGLAATAAGAPELRDGTDLLGMLAGKTAPRGTLVGVYGRPGTRRFTMMVRSGPWKYIFIANGGRELLFDLARDPQERENLAGREPEVAAGLRAIAERQLATPTGEPALEGSGLRRFDFEMRPRRRIHQFDLSRGVTGFPERPGDVLKQRG